MLAAATQFVAAFDVSEVLALVAAILALGAFLVAWREAQRNNRAIVKLTDFHATYTGARDHRKCYILKVCIKNCGVALQNAEMRLCYCGPGKSGSFSIQMHLDERSCVSSAFLRGTFARYQMSSENRRDVDLLRYLKDLSVQEPALCLYNSTYLVKAFDICRHGDWLRRAWNRGAFRLSFQRRVGEGDAGKGVFKTYRLPTFIDRKMQLEFFLSGLKKLEGPGESSS